jgi:hypothetical protein
MTHERKMLERLRRRLVLQGLLIVTSQLVVLRYALDASDTVPAICAFLILGLTVVILVSDLRAAP